MSTGSGEPCPSRPQRELPSADGGDVGGSLSDCGGGSSFSDAGLIAELDQALGGIEDALYTINCTLSQTVQKRCDQVPECVAGIEQQLREKWQQGVKTCDECKQLAANGAAGTIEYAISCANSCIEECVADCSPGTGAVEGQCCSTCGQSPCCCKQGECVPCPQKTGTQRYVAWCSKITGNYLVIPEGDPSPGTDYDQIAGPADQATVQAEASASCYGQHQQQPTQPSLPQYIPLTVTSGDCSILQYATASGRFQASGGAAALQLSTNVRELVTDTVLSLGQTLPIFNPTTGIFNGIAAFISTPMVVAAQFGDQISEALGCTDSSFSQAYQALASFSYVSKYVGVDLSVPMAPYQYVVNSACRNNQLTPEQATAAYLANAFDGSTLDIHWAIAGRCNPAMNWYVQATKSKADPLRLANMRLRGLIDGTEYNTRMRELGFLEQDVVDNIFQLSYQLPTLSDIIRLMVRDADDESPSGPVNKFNLDANFTDKYQTQLRQWSEQQGVPEKFAQYAWRAHWSIPSPTQLFTFWHRLRNNKDFPTLFDDITAALIQQDILPYWHKHYFATSYLPMGRIDIRRSYQIGVMKDEDLEPAYKQLGYSDDTAAKLGTFTRRLRDNSIAGAAPIKQWQKLAIDKATARQRLIDSGYPADKVDIALTNAEHGFITSPYALAFIRGDLPRDTFITSLVNIGVSQGGASRIADQLALKVTKHAALHDYIVGVVSRQDAMTTMQQYGMNTDIINNLLTIADQTINHEFVRRCQNGIKRRYLTAELNEQDATNELLSRGTELSRANRLVDWWKCERGSYGRAVSASKLCKWLSEGVITSTDFTYRLQRLGYSIDDANRIMQDCLISFNAKLLAQAKKQAAQQAASQIRADRLAARAAAAQVRETAKLERALNQRRATARRRESQLLSAGDKLTKACGCNLPDAFNLVKSESQRVKNQYGLTIDESIQVILRASESSTTIPLNTFPSVVDALAQIVSDQSLTPEIDLSTEVVLTGATVTSDGNVQPL